MPSFHLRLNGYLVDWSWYYLEKKIAYLISSWVKLLPESWPVAILPLANPLPANWSAEWKSIPYPTVTPFHDSIDNLILQPSEFCSKIWYITASGFKFFLSVWCWLPLFLSGCYYQVFHRKPSFDALLSSLLNSKSNWLRIYKWENKKQNYGC